MSTWSNKVKKYFVCFLVACVVLFSSQVIANENHDNSGVVLQLTGTGNEVEMFLPGLDEPAQCFEGIDVIDLATGSIIGEAIDCLSEIEQDGRGLSLLGTTIFSLPNGEFMVRGQVTVQPTFSRMITPEGMVVTHITGAATNEGNNVIEGSGAFERVGANARLQGMINAELMDEGIVQFSCFFVFTNINLQ